MKNIKDYISEAFITKDNIKDIEKSLPSENEEKLNDLIEKYWDKSLYKVEIYLNNVRELTELKIKICKKFFNKNGLPNIVDVAEDDDTRLLVFKMASKMIKDGERDKMFNNPTREQTTAILGAVAKDIINELDGIENIEDLG